MADGRGKSDEELIAEAVRAGRVRIISPGVSGLAPGDSGQRWRKQAGLPRALREKHARRRALIRDMLDAGWSIDLVAERMGVQPQRVRQVMRDLGMELPDVKRRARKAKHCAACGAPVGAGYKHCAGCRKPRRR